MKLIRTGRILAWFVKDLRMLRVHPGVRIKALPLQVKPYRPPGLWCFTLRGPGRPLLWGFPQPLHPIETIASLRGFDGDLRALAEARAGTWLDYTAHLARFLFVTPETVRLVWHLLTPLDPPTPWQLVEPKEPEWESAIASLWAACGAVPGEAGPWVSIANARRPQFWTHECTGDIEL